MDEQYRKDLQFVKDKILSIYDSFFDDKLFLEIDSITFLSFRIDELKKQVKFLSSKNTIDTKQFIPIFILSEKIKLSFRKEDIHVDNRRIVISKLNIFENLLIQRLFQRAIDVLDDVIFSSNYLKKQEDFYVKIEQSRSLLREELGRQDEEL